ncbi:YdhK family protein [Rothia sp. AR01]|uniref:YdhK family protein n=1 Tax=Rothia santali TaxID=2949643 RepID=A0A9X2HCC4_9MICC|nr:YdhK family protein [Rothia santali]MCP3424459.1 YdhK family protein [Rothia santali]
MTRNITTLLAAGILGGTALLTGCAAGGDDDAAPSASASASQGGEEGHGGHGGMAHGGDGEHGGGMRHSMDGGPVPEGMTPAADPEYPVGSEVTLAADHMEGMDGAPATIVGAYDTYAYSVDYAPTTGGDRVEDHRWVVQEELTGAGPDRLADGAEVTLEAGHMEGMEGAAATIASSTDETVYVVDYKADGMTMTNHRWVVESEIRPAS